MLKKVVRKINHFLYRRYQRKEEKRLFPLRKRFYSQFVKPGDIVFDVGANTGNRTRVFLALGAKVIAIEPQPACIKILKSNFDDRVVIEPVALGDKEDTLEMHLASDPTLSSLSKDFIRNTSAERFKNYTWDKKMMVPVTTMDNLINKHGVPAYCKIDVEGFEYNVLSGLSNWIPVISFEYCVPEMCDSLNKCIDRLYEMNPAVKFNFNVEENMEMLLDEWADYPTFKKLIAETKFLDTLFGDIFCKN